MDLTLKSKEPFHYKNKIGFIFVIFFYLLFPMKEVRAEKSNFTIYGDIFQIAIPFSAGLVSVYKDDLEGLKRYIPVYFGGVLSVALLKRTFLRSRPDNRGYSSFPSGHAVSAFLGGFYARKRYGNLLGSVFLIPAFFVGFSRVEAKRHRWEDVFGSAVLSYLLMDFFIPRLEKKMKASHIPQVSFFVSQKSFQVNLNWSIR